MATTAKRVKDARKPKFSSRKHNRCQLCGRPRAFLRKFGICRLCFRGLALRGEIPGVSGRAATSIKSFLQLISRWRAMLEKKDEAFSVRALMDDVIRTSGMQAYLEKSETRFRRGTRRWIFPLPN